MNKSVLWVLLYASLCAQAIQASDEEGSHNNRRSYAEQAESAHPERNWKQFINDQTEEDVEMAKKVIDSYKAPDIKNAIDELFAHFEIVNNTVNQTIDALDKKCKKTAKDRQEAERCQQAVQYLKTAMSHPYLPLAIAHKVVTSDKAFTTIEGYIELLIIRILASSKN